MQPSPPVTGTDPAGGVVVIGGGPAGLMAAEVLSAHGYRVDLYDAMASVGRKFLLAGIGGLNITHSEAYDAFCTRYLPRAQGPVLQPLLDGFRPDDLRAWVHALGVETFVGSSGRVFPREMKAAPLLRAWLHRLRASGVRLHVRHRWTGWTAQGGLQFVTPAGELTVQPQATVLALGGGSWPQLGSDAAWVPWLSARGVAVAPLLSANCGFDCDWSAHLRERFAGSPLKPVLARWRDAAGLMHSRRGECVLSAHGLEGSLVYALSHDLRMQIEQTGAATVWLDLLPDVPADKVLAGVAHPRGARSLSSHLQSRLGLTGVKVALLHEMLGKAALQDGAALATAIKALPIFLKSARPLAEAISTAGGVAFGGLDETLMLRHLPGVFVAGEMLDWEAPTGGYLLTACMATGRAAGAGAVEWLRAGQQPVQSG